MIYTDCTLLNFTNFKEEFFNYNLESGTYSEMSKNVEYPFLYKHGCSDDEVKIIVDKIDEEFRKFTKALFDCNKKKYVGIKQGSLMVSTYAPRFPDKYAWYESKIERITYNAVYTKKCGNWLTVKVHNGYYQFDTTGPRDDSDIKMIKSYIRNKKIKKILER